MKVRTWLVIVGALLAAAALPGPAAVADESAPLCVESGSATACARWVSSVNGFRMVANASSSSPYIVNVYRATVVNGGVQSALGLETIGGRAGTTFHRVRSSLLLPSWSGFFRAWVRVRNPHTGAVREFIVRTWPFP